MPYGGDGRASPGAAQGDGVNAATNGATSGRASSARQDDRVVPIPGSRTPAHIAENLSAARVHPRADTLARVDEALAGFVTQGAGSLLT
jgi:hypothetical protein